MASVGFRLSDRVYGLNAEQAQFLAGQLQRRLTIPAPRRRDRGRDLDAVDG